MFLKCLLAAVLVFQGCVAFAPRITDGVNAAPGQFPYQVSIRWGIPPLLKYRHVCGGSILNERYILTAGHCILKLGFFQVAAGKLFLNQVESTEQVIDVVETFVHAGYPGGVAQHDIALMKLKTPLFFNDRVQPILLPAQNELQVGDAVLSGWGSVSKTLLPRLPAQLQTAVVPLLDNAECLSQLKQVNAVIGGQPELFDTQICSGAGPTNTVSACSGDSGGPLAQIVNGRSVQVGIVSWGVMPCGAGMPSVYTRVASYVDWIHERMH